VKLEKWPEPVNGIPKIDFREGLFNLKINAQANFAQPTIG
jgi:hypothetical protein